MSNFKCPICLRETERKKEHKTTQLYGNGTEHSVCDSCADVVDMLRGGSPEESCVLVVRLSVFHRALLSGFSPFWGKNDAEVLKALAMRWIEENIGTNSVVLLCEMNEKVKGDIGIRSVCKIEKNDNPEKSSPVLVEKVAAPCEAVAFGGFVFRDCVGEPFAYDSLTPATHGKTTYYLDANGMMRIERAGYPCATHAHLADILYLYDHPKDVKKLLNHIDHNRRPIITGFLKDVPVESLQPIKKEEKKECPEKDCINRSPTMCPFCTNKSRYETAKMKKMKEIRQLGIKMGL